MSRAPIDEKSLAGMIELTRMAVELAAGISSDVELDVSVGWSFVEDILGRARQAQAAGAVPPFSCRGEGCWGCCRGEITVTDLEWVQIRPRVPVEVARQVHARREVFEDPEAVKTQLCPLLKDGKCTVYDVRPAVCRAYHVVTPAEWCWPERVGVRGVGRLALLQASPMAIAVRIMQARGEDAVRSMGEWILAEGRLM